MPGNTWTIDGFSESSSNWLVRVRGSGAFAAAKLNSGAATDDNKGETSSYMHFFLYVIIHSK